MFRALAAMFTGALIVGACSTESSDSGPGIEPSMTHTFEALAIDVGQELSNVCQSWSLDNDEPIFVSKVRQRNDGAWHHSNWYFVPENVYPGPDGTWDCNQRGFGDVSAALAGGVFFAQSTQTMQELQAFPDGAVVEIPPRHKIVGGVHLVNITGTPLETSLSFDIETLPEEDIEIRLRPISFTNTALDIEPMAESRFEMSCNLGEQFELYLGQPADYNIYYVLAHFHEWGNYFRLSFVDDDDAERTVFELKNSIGEPLGATFDPPIPSEGAPWLRVECGYLNDTDRRLRYGLGGQEMCVFLAYTDADLVIGATSGENTPMGQSEDGVYMNETSCGPVLAVPAM